MERRALQHAVCTCLWIVGKAERVRFTRCHRLPAGRSAARRCSAWTTPRRCRRRSSRPPRAFPYTAYPPRASHRQRRQLSTALHVREEHCVRRILQTAPSLQQNLQSEPSAFRWLPVFTTPAKPLGAYDRSRANSLPRVPYVGRPSRYCGLHDTTSPHTVTSPNDIDKRRLVTIIIPNLLDLLPSWFHVRPTIAGRHDC